MTRLLTLLVGILAMLALMAGPSLAHPHAKAETGFVGPTPEQAAHSGGKAMIAHRGIQCAVEGNPHTAEHDGNQHLTSLPLDCRSPIGD